MTSNDVLLKIESMLPFFTNNEKIIADYIVEHAHEVVLSSTKDIALRCDVSEPTLIRFTQKLGYKGFKEFKLRLSANLGSHTTSPTLSDITQEDSTLDIYNKLAAYVIASIQNTKSTLDPNQLDHVVDCIYTAAKKQNTVFLSGLGTSSIQIRNLQTKMMRLHIPTVYYEDIHFELEACTSLEKSDVLICITTLGLTIENHQIIDIAKRKGATIIVITQYGNTKIASKADYVLYTSVTETDNRLVNPASISVQSLVIDTLFFALVMKMDHNQITADVQASREIISEFGHYIKKSSD